jgi:hypothetical protein
MTSEGRGILSLVNYLYTTENNDVYLLACYRECATNRGRMLRVRARRGNRVVRLGIAARILVAAVGVEPTRGVNPGRF